MKQVLSPKNLKLLNHFLDSNVLIAFDFDGTLAPIHPDPELAQMLPTTRTLLKEVSALYPVAVISGRSRADIAARLQGTGIGHEALVGDHGAELAPGAKVLKTWMVEHRVFFEQTFGDIPHIILEPKDFSYSVHMRSSAAQRKVHKKLQNLTEELAEFRIIPGKDLFNFVPKGTPDKGDALKFLLQKTSCERALYAGDDVTDEDVFRLDDPAWLVGIHVGKRLSSKARYYLNAQTDIDLLLKALVSTRQNNA